MKQRRKFPTGTTLNKELKKAIRRLESLGVCYPNRYFELLSRKYSLKGVTYPRILMRLGEPNIRKHPQYKMILRRQGKFLDYGCGTGDDMRELIRDGYPSEKVRGYDVNWRCINLGFDFYMDRNEIRSKFTVSREFPFKGWSLDTVYSGSVLHVLRNQQIISVYLSNACSALRPGGVIFGSTLGTIASLKSHEKLTIITRGELKDLLEEAGFGSIKIIRKLNNLRNGHRYRLWFYAVKKKESE